MADNMATELMATEERTAVAMDEMIESSESHLELYVVMALLSTLCFIGTAGNALVLYVFKQKKDDLVSNLFIMALAAVDFMTCLVVIPSTICKYGLYYLILVIPSTICKYVLYYLIVVIPSTICKFIGKYGLYYLML